MVCIHFLKMVNEKSAVMIKDVAIEGFTGLPEELMNEAMDISKAGRRKAHSQ